MSRRRMPRRPLAARLAARLARPAIRRGALVAGLAAALVAGIGIPATAYWSAGSSSSSAGGALVTAIGTAPVASGSVSAQSVTLAWTAAQLGDGTTVTDYVVRRYASDNSEATIASGCTGVVRALGCTETGVPEGAWTYTITPRYATNWIGAEGAKSASLRVDVTAPTLALSSTTPAGTAWDAATRTLFHDGKSSRTITLTATVADGGSGPDSATTSSLSFTGGTGTGWSHTAGTVSATSGTATLNPITIPATGTTSASLTVTARDVAQNATMTSVSLVPDTTAPTAPSVTVASTGGTGYSGTVTSTDSGGSGFLRTDVTGRINTASGGTCPAGGYPFSLSITQTTGQFPFSLNPGQCVAYAATTYDRVGNAGTVASGTFIAS